MLPIFPQCNFRLVFFQVHTFINIISTNSQDDQVAIIIMGCLLGWFTKGFLLFHINIIKM